MFKSICYIYAILALAALFNCAAAVEFPASIQKCHISDEKCMIEQTNKFFRTYRHGIPELGIPDMEPLKLGNIKVLGNKDSAIGTNLILTDVTIHKFTMMNTTSFRGFTRDISKPIKVTLTYYYPEMIVKAKYKISGRILLLEIKGDGDVEFVLTGMHAKTKGVFKPVKRDGKVHLSLEDYQVSFDTDKMKINMTNLFNGDKVLSDSVLAVINENWRMLSDDFTPPLKEALSKFDKTYMPKIMDAVPYEDYFLPEEA